MNAIGKILKSALVVLAVILVVLAAGFFLIGDYLITAGVENGGSAALGVPVKVSGVHLSVLRGVVTIDDLQVANPPGYKNEYMLELGHGKVEVDIRSLLSDTVHIRQINLDGINLAIEQKMLSSNVKDLLGGMKVKGKSAGANKPEAQAKEPGKKLVVDQLDITNTEARLVATMGASGGTNVKLSPIRMSNLGSNRPLSVAELTTKVFAAIIDGVTRQGAGLLPEDVVSGMKGELGKIPELGGEQGRKIIEEGTKAIEGIKGLFKPKK